MPRFSRWKVARTAVVRAGEYYVMALDNYREAVLSEVADRKADGTPGSAL